MKHKNEDSLEIQEIPSESKSGLVARKSYRMPVREKENFLLVIDSNTYPLLDISSRGVCISVGAATSIASQGFISGCKIILDEKSFEGLDGKVVHYSLDFDLNWICGIEWLNIDADTMKNIDDILLALRKEMFDTQETMMID